MTSFALKEDEKVFLRKLLSLFKIDGKPADELVTEGQLLIFGAIVLKKSKRIQIITSTQYGKSLIVALACIILSCIDGEMVSIPAPSEDKAKIIMRYYLQHLGDHPLFYEQLEKQDKVDRLIMETSRDRLVLKNRGGVFILSVHSKDSQRGFEAAMGEGSRIVIEDESSLIPDAIESTVFRMIAGKKDAMYVKIGNPFYKNHFWKSSQDERYLQIYIDYRQGIREGRYDIDFIEEARTKPNFDILFGCKFPDDDAMGADGFLRLMSDQEIKSCQVTPTEHAGFKVLGVDPAAGGDNSSIVLKSAYGMEVLFNQKLDNTMDLVGVVADLYRKHGGSMVIVDKTGIGQGVYDRLKDMGFPIRGVSFAEKPSGEQYFNMKAELYWRLRTWLLQGGRMFTNRGWDELYNIKYKNKDGRILIQPKESLLRLGILSPNVVDAAVLSLYVTDNAIKNQRIMRGRGAVFQDRMVEIWQYGR